MLLLSPGFLLITAALLFVYYLVPPRFQWTVLLAGSVGGYLIWAPEGLGYLLFAALSSYFAARIMEGSSKPARRRILLLCLGANFGLLLLCKARLVTASLALPLGISFFLFQSMGYCIDVFRGTAPAERSFPRHLLLVSFFPQLIQGPIGRYGPLSSQLFAPRPRDSREISFGAQRMLWGAFKKLVIADRLAPAVAILRSSEQGFFFLTLFYALQIYADFTGGIDIVLGLAQMFGVSLPENFRRPFLSKSVAEYWRRWHITLGAWMKDYIFYPLSISAPLRRLGKYARKRWGSFGKRLPLSIATIVTWMATGLWHGLTPNFLLWGLLNCAVILLSQELSPLCRRNPWKERPWYAGFEILHTFLLMNLIRACDLFPRPADYFRRMGSLASPSGWQLPSLGLSKADWVILALGLAAMLTVSLIQEKRGSIRMLLSAKQQWLRWCLWFALFLAVLLFGRYGVGYEASSFIYNQF